jgi:hypothetical protein
MAVAVIALFVSLSGVSYGVATRSSGSEDPVARASGHLPASGYGRFKDGPVLTTDGPTDLLRLSLPPGRWLIFAKATVSVNIVEFECRVVAGSDFDRARLGNVVGAGREVLTLTVFHRSATSFTAKLRCPDNQPQTGYQVTDLKLHALRLASLTNSAG